MILSELLLYQENALSAIKGKERQKSTRNSKQHVLESTVQETSEAEMKEKTEEIVGVQVKQEDIGGNDYEYGNLEDISWVVKLEEWELDGVLEENLNFISNGGGGQNSFEEEIPGANGEVAKSSEHVNQLSRVQEDCDKEGKSANGLEDVEGTVDNDISKSPGAMDNCSRVQEGGDRDGKSANAVEDDEYNEENNVIKSPGCMNDISGIPEGVDEEGKSADEGERTNNVKHDECRIDDNIMKSPGHVNGFSGVQDCGGGEERIKDDEGNNVNKSPAHMDDCSRFKEGEKEGNCADDMEDDRYNKDNYITESSGDMNDFSGVQEGGDKEGRRASVEDNNVIELPTHMGDFSRVQGGTGVEGKSACKRENIGDLREKGGKEGNDSMQSPGCMDIGVQEVGDEEQKSADDMEDNDDDRDSKFMESLGHTEVQDGCLKEVDCADDVKDTGVGDDNEKAEDPSLIIPVKQTHQEIQVTTVHVKGLVKSWNEEKLREICKQYGKIVDVRLPRNFGARHKDFGFIVFATHKSALACVEGINHANLGGEIKIKADLAKPRDKLRKKIRWGKHHTGSNKVETELKGQTHGDKAKGTGKGRMAIAKGEILAPPWLKSTKERKPNNQNMSSKESQDANAVKKDGKIKYLNKKMNGHGKRKIDHDFNERRSKKSRGNARSKHSNRSSTRKPHPKERNSSFSGTKRRHFDMEPHAGYIEPATRKPAQHYERSLGVALGRQQQSHESYLQSTFQNQNQHSLRYVAPAFGRDILPHAGYIEPVVEKQGFVRYDSNLRRAGGYSGQGSQESAYFRGSAALPSNSENTIGYSTYQGDASITTYRYSSGTYMPRLQYR